MALGAAPDVRLWSLAGGVQVRFVDPMRARGWTTTLDVGAGATRFDSDAFAVGDETAELNRTCFSSYGRPPPGAARAGTCREASSATAARP